MFHLKNYCVVVALLIVHQTYAQFPKKWTVQTVANEASQIIEKLNFPKIITHDSIFINEQQQLLQVLGKNGYLQPDLQTLKVSDSLIISYLNLGKRTEYFSFELEEEVLKSEIFSDLSIKNKTLPIGQSEFYLEKVVQYYQNNGYPFAKAQWVNWTFNQKGDLKADLKVEKGIPKLIDKIIIEPYTNFPEKYLVHYFKIANKSPYNEQILKNISLKIPLLTFIKEIKKPEVTFTKDTTYLFLFWEKANKNSVDGIVGFNTIENKIKFNGHFNLKLTNTFNKGENFDLNWLSDGNRSQQFSFLLKIPYVVATPFDVAFELDMYKKDTLFYNINTQFKMLYQFQNNQTIGFAWLYKTSELLTQKTSDFDNFKSNFYGITYEYQQSYEGNKLLNNKLLWKSSFLKGKRSSEKQLQLMSDLDYVVDIDNSKYITLRNQTAYLKTNHIVENELFRLGGINNARGFREKNIPASIYSTLWNDFHYFDGIATTFSLLTDFSYLKNQWQTENYLYSLGIGFIYNYNKGTLNLQYCFGNQVNTSFSFKNGILHIQYIQNF